jgi:hypothetical protein
MLFAASVGFYDRGIVDLYETFLRMCEHGEMIEAGGFKYLKWSVGEQVELWTHLKDGKPEMLFNSYYAGHTRMKVALLEKMPRRETTLSDGAFLCRGCASAGAGWIAGRNPFIFDTLDYHRYDGVSLPRLCTVQLTAFSFQMTGYENEDEFDEAYPADEEGYCWDYKHFVPALMLKRRDEAGELQAATTEISGYVRDTGIITNPATGLDFCWAKLETIGGEIDVVCAPDKLSGYLVTGGIAATQCYLYGRLTEDECN